MDEPYLKLSIPAWQQERSPHAHNIWAGDVGKHPQDFAHSYHLSSPLLIAFVLEAIL